MYFNTVIPCEYCDVVYFHTLLLTQKIPTERKLNFKILLKTLFHRQDRHPERYQHLSCIQLVVGHAFDMNAKLNLTLPHQRLMFKITRNILNTCNFFLKMYMSSSWFLGPRIILNFTKLFDQNRESFKSLWLRLFLGLATKALNSKYHNNLFDYIASSLCWPLNVSNSHKINAYTG